jgi:alkylation response protein AidB-like acyl-CoA dehydrogenase
VLWSTLEESGLTLAWVPEEHGGAGAEVADGFGVLRVAGEYAAPVPLAETLMAGFVLARAGITSPAEGAMTVAPVYPTDRLEIAADGTLRGVARDVPFARWTRHIAVVARRGGEDRVALVPMAGCRIAEGQSLAGEPRDAVTFDGARAVEVGTGFDLDQLTLLGAAVRSMQMAGALERALNQALEHALTRVQFGRPIGNFQAIQHTLAQFAGESAAATAAADAAAEAIAAGGPLTAEDTVAEVAAAKIRVGEAASLGSAFAHQIHGAMGFTYELSLHHVTRRMWSWRDEFGGESAWSVRLGALAARLGADELWPLVTGVRTR